MSFLVFRSLSMLLQQIRLETQTAHQKVEALLLPILKRVRSTEDYIKILDAFYGYYLVVEPSAHHYANPIVFGDLLLRKKIVLMQHEYWQLSQQLPQGVMPNFFPTIVNEYQAAGVLYVLEGSTLGGRLIHNILEQKLGSERAKKLQFFTPYGAATDEMWQQFLAGLALYDHSGSEQQQQVIEGAHCCFQSMYDHLNLHLTFPTNLAHDCK